MQARLMGYTAKKRLKLDAVPTRFVHRPQKMDRKRTDRLANRNTKKVSCAIIREFSKLDYPGPGLGDRQY